MSKLKTQLIYLLPIFLLFESYRFYAIGTFSVTLSFVTICLIIIIGLVESFSKPKILFYDLLLALIYLIVVLISYANAPEGASITSMMLYIFYIIFYLFSIHRHDKTKLQNTLSLFIVIVTIAAFYGIYQFFAYIYDWPLQSLTIPGFMTEGYNTNATINILGTRVKRINSIFLEPSFLSQFTAIVIILILNTRNRLKFSNFSKFLILIGNFLAFVLSFSGTGIIILGVGLVYIFLKSEFKTKVKVTIYILIGTILAIYLVPSFVIVIFNRLNEFDNINASSGIRFVYSYQAMFETMKNHFFGYGPGTDTIIIRYVGINETNVASGYAKIGIELGIIGFVCLIILLIQLFVKSRKADVFLLFLLVLLINYLGGNYLTNYFWIFVSLINVNNNYIMNALKREESQ